MKPKQKTKPFDFFESVPDPVNLDPLCQKILGLTEAEFMRLFEVPTGPD